MSRLYQHPDGHSIDFDNNTLTVVSGDGMAVSVPMGIGGLRDLAKGFTESDCARQAGAALAENFLDAMLAGPDHAKAVNMLAAVLVDIASLKHHEHAAAGFAGALVDVIKRGIDERESAICDGPSNIEYTCPVCGGETGFLNVRHQHFEVCHSCKKYLHFGENLFSGWRSETPEIWAINQKTLDSYTQFDPPPVQEFDAGMNSAIPF